MRAGLFKNSLEQTWQPLLFQCYPGQPATVERYIRKTGYEEKETELFMQVLPQPACFFCGLMTEFQHQQPCSIPTRLFRIIPKRNSRPAPENRRKSKNTEFPYSTLKIHASPPHSRLPRRKKDSRIPSFPVLLNGHSTGYLLLSRIRETCMNPQIFPVTRQPRLKQRT